MTHVGIIRTHSHQAKAKAIANKWVLLFSSQPFTLSNVKDQRKHSLSRSLGVNEALCASTKSAGNGSFTLAPKSETESTNGLTKW